MKPKKSMIFGQFRIDGWLCSCGECYFNPDQAQRILLLNKLKKQVFRLKLNQVRSNLILRIPKEVSDAMSLRDGSEVEFCLQDGKMVIKSAERT